MPKASARRLSIVLGVVALVAVVACCWSMRRELRAWYLLRTNFERLGINAQGYPEYRHLASDIIFTWLPGGAFQMGSDDQERMWVVKERWKDEPRNRDAAEYDAKLLLREQPRHRVELSPFLIGKFEVTQGQWIALIGNNPSLSKGDDHPVENISWFESQEFCAKAGLMLPTEAQWEYACRGGTTGPYGGTGNIEEMGWTVADDLQEHQPVGRKKANAFGLCDMHGNVAEWVVDAMDEVFYSRAEASILDPVCSNEPREQRGVGLPPESYDQAHSTRIARGGGVNPPLVCRSATREPTFPMHKSPSLGFRVAFSLR